MHGELIYRDFFTVVTPGSYYTVAWLFQIFGTNLMVMRWAVLALGLGILIATLIAARHVMAWPFAAAAALMTSVWGWFLVAPNFYSWEAAFFALIALVCYLRSVDSSRSAWLVWAGIASWDHRPRETERRRVHRGGPVSHDLAVEGVRLRATTFEPRFNRSLRFVAGLCVPIVPALLYLVLAGAGPVLVRELDLLPADQVSAAFRPAVPLVPGRTSAIRAMIHGSLPSGPSTKSGPAS